jgi:CHAT domain-containing protein/tetratricopeptide (TPR) repeat protein
MKKVLIGLLVLNLSLSGLELWLPQHVLAQDQAQQARMSVTLLAQLANQQFQKGQYEQAIAIWQKALLLARQFMFKKTEAIILNNIGLAYFNIGQPQKALEYYNQVLPVAREVKDRTQEATALYNIGEVYRNTGQPQKALEYYNQILPFAKEVKDPNVEARTLFSIGEVYITIGQPQKALKYYNQALPILRKVNDRVGEATTLSSIGAIYSAIGPLQKAIEYFNQALPIFREIKDRKQEATLLVLISAFYIATSQPEKALEYFNQALPIFRETKDRRKEATMLGSIGRLYSTMSQPQKALKYYSQALLIFRETKDRKQEAATLGSIGAIYSDIGQQEKELEYYNQALLIFRETKDRKQEAATLGSIGAIYSNIGQPRKALEYYNQALPILREVKDRDGEATTLVGIGRIYNMMGQVQKALENYTESLSIIRETKDRNGEDLPFAHKLNSSLPLIQIGAIYSNIGQPRKALEYLNQALPIAKESKIKIVEAVILLLSGENYQSIGQPQKALEYYTQVLSIFKESKLQTVESDVLKKLAVLERSRGDLQAALNHIESAIKIIETIRAEIVIQEFRTSFFASKQDYYELYIDVLMQLHKQQPSKGFDVIALQVSERARARSLLDLLKESKADIRQGVDPKLLEQEKNLQVQFNALEKRRIELYSKTPTKSQITDFEREYDALLSQSQDLATQIRSDSPRYAALTQPKPFTLVELKQQVLDNNTVLLEYFVGAERSYLWAVTQAGITSYELPKQTELEAATQKFLELVRNPNAKLAEITQAGKPLTKILLGPIAKQLGQKRLLIVSNGSLQYLPFAALPDPANAQPLLVNHEIVNLPSASTLATLRQELNGRKPAAKTVAVFADPVFSATDDRVSNSKKSLTSQNKPPQNNLSDRPSSPATPIRSVLQDTGINFGRLGNTRKEAEDILKLLPAHTRTQSFDFAADRANVLNSDLSQYRIIHFATHGVLNTTRPELSSVVLSLVDPQGRPQNGFLRLNDIFNLNLPAELVVLSACQTGLGQNIRGEGLIGLTRGFMYAGAPRVLVSLWSVNDESTAVLMKDFYQIMLEKNLPPAAALRAAQLEMLQQPNWQSPYYWAAFTLQGEWR